MELLWTETNVSADTYYPEEINHNYKRAPTDESIRIAKEYEEIIHKQIAEKILAKNNIFNYTIVFARHHLTQEPFFYLKICINGREFSETFRLNNYEDTNPDKLIERINTWMCSKILDNPIHDCLVAFMMGGKLPYKIIDGQVI